MQAALRVDAVLVGRSSLAHRSGYGTGGMTKPRLLAVLFRRLGGRTCLVAWADVEHCDDAAGRLTLRRGATGSKQ